MGVKNKDKCACQGHGCIGIIEEPQEKHGILRLAIIDVEATVYWYSITQVITVILILAKYGLAWAVGWRGGKSAVYSRWLPQVHVCIIMIQTRVPPVGHSLLAPLYPSTLWFSQFDSEPASLRIQVRVTASVVRSRHA
ncbi:hypothetical protein EDB85DRAFT_2278840 [Lactarius pseudohatsudake]|nr:hypothetical protein EDB85DRAFT_2278840 [Lactarius pseudohatsudake]